MAVWVMTLDKALTKVTFWNCVNAQKYTLKNRIVSKEVDNMKAYLCHEKLDKKEQAEMDRDILWMEKAKDFEESDVDKSQENEKVETEPQVEHENMNENEQISEQKDLDDISDSNIIEERDIVCHLDEFN
eukprot:CAMPEP_0116874204 /NCGR_PEP_ID=MMETSP0463-20121206/5641_1 /TAXON_ID=181622 /ORGANISM="Strombidinopsis sp, Strain SopsisLIS2011" /LENGTH=129 /DNA_ID=CAMNT_0004517565 /DNA_START=622 /DNA_END=1011 /DNA_ORIENTATION=-